MKPMEERLLRLTEVLEKVTLEKTTLYARRRKGSFPQKHTVRQQYERFNLIGRPQSNS